jgi:hypothetical protein
MTPFEPLKDNKLWRRSLSVVLGSAFVIWALVAVRKGHITITKQNYTFYVAREPVLFWFAVIAVFVLGIALVYRGIRGKS